MTNTMSPTQVYSIYIKATADQVWEAITKPEWTEKYLYASLCEYDLKPGGKYQSVPGDIFKQSVEGTEYPVPDTMTDGEVLEVDAPNRLVQTFRLTMDEAMMAEGFTRLTWEIQELQPKFTKLTVTHELEKAPLLSVLVSGGNEDVGAGGGWAEILSGLKTVLETGDVLRTS